MSHSTLLEQMTEQETAATEAAEQDFQKLVVRLANGNDDPLLTEVQAVLAKLNNSPDDLRAAVDTRKRRDVRRSTIVAAANALAERAKLEQQLETASAKLEAAQDEHRHTARPIHIRLNEISGMQTDAFHARRELQITCTDPAIRKSIAANKASLQFVEPRIRDAQGLVARLKQTLAAGVVRRGPVSISQQLDTAQATLAGLVDEQQRLVAEQNELHEKLVWA